MTEQTDAAEVREALRTILAEHDAKWHAQPNSLIAHEARASLLARLAAREAAARAEALRGILFRVETACDGYSHLMDEDVPSDITDLAAYEQGAHNAAEASRLHRPHGRSGVVSGGEVAMNGPCSGPLLGSARLPWTAYQSRPTPPAETGDQP